MQIQRRTMSISPSVSSQRWSLDRFYILPSALDVTVTLIESLALSPSQTSGLLDPPRPSDTSAPHQLVPSLPSTTVTAEHSTSPIADTMITFTVDAPAGPITTTIDMAPGSCEFDLSNGIVCGGSFSGKPYTTVITSLETSTISESSAATSVIQGEGSVTNASSQSSNTGSIGISTLFGMSVTTISITSTATFWESSTAVDPEISSTPISATSSSLASVVSKSASAAAPSQTEAPTSTTTLATAHPDSKSTNAAIVAPVIITIILLTCGAFVVFWLRRRRREQLRVRNLEARAEWFQPGHTDEIRAKMMEMDEEKVNNAAKAGMEPKPMS